MMTPEQYLALKQLAEAMQNSRVIAFVGAGASRQSNYPTWEQLLDNLREQLQGVAEPSVIDDLDEQKAAESDPRWIAEAYTLALKDRIDRDEAIERAIHDGTQTGYGEIHRLLARLPIKHFITTNYDDLIEQACDERKQGELPCRSFSAVKEKDFNGFLKTFASQARSRRSGTRPGEQDRRSVLHLHGTLDGGDMTLALSDYDEQYLGEGMLLRMFTIFATSTVVFIGTSLTDIDLMQMIRRAHWHGDKTVRHYAFLHRTSRARAQALAKSYGIRSIFYGKADEPGDHSDLNRVLSHLLELTETLEGDEVPRPRGNRPPVLPGADDRGVGEFELMVKDLIRPPPEDAPLVAIHGLKADDADRLLRAVAVDYRRVPRRFAFHNVVWLSPKRIGLFPSRANVRMPRAVEHALVGEITRVLGEHRLTATLDRAMNQRQLAEVAGRQPTLLVFAGADDIYARACPNCDHEFAENGQACGRSRLGDILSALPTGSVAIIAAEDPPWRDDPAWRHVEIAAPPRTADDDAEDQPALADTLSGDRPDEDDLALRWELLAALSIMAAPTRTDELAARLHRSPADLTRTLNHLVEVKLVCSDPAPDAPAEVDVCHEVRAAFLAEACERPSQLYESFCDTTQRLLEWARRTIESLRHWHHDNAQYERMNELLPDFMTIFEAGCWLEPGDLEHPDQHLQLGIEIATALYLTGRWGEATGYGDYLAHAAERVENQRLRVDVWLLQARIWSLAHLSEDDLDRAVELAEQAERNSEPASLQHRKAMIRRGVIEFRKGQADAALATFRTVWESMADECTKEPQQFDRDAATVSDEAAGWYVQAELDRIRRSDGDSYPDHDEAIRKLLSVLDCRAELLTKLRSNRERGHFWSLRGEVLYEGRRISSARRYFARALVAAHEFRDRLLEAKAKLGLGKCDNNRQLVEEAARVFRALNLDEAEGAAEREARRMDATEPEAEERSRAPSLVLIVGADRSGKSTALEIATAYLARSGYDPVDRSDETSTWPEDPNLDHTDRIRELRREMPPKGVVVGTVTEDTPFEVINNPNEREALQDSLLIHMEPIYRGGITPWMERVPEVGGRPPEDFDRWDSELEYSGISYVSIDSNVPILELEREVREVFSYSYLSVDDLLQQNRGKWGDLKR